MTTSWLQVYSEYAYGPFHNSHFLGLLFIHVVCLLFTDTSQPAVAD